MNKRMKYVILALLVGSCVLTGCGQEEVVVETEEIVTYEPTAEERKEWAAEAGEWIITRHDSGYDGRIGVFVGLDMQLVTVRAGSHYRMSETLNLCIRYKDNGSDDWVTLQALEIGVGDYLIINSSAAGVDSISVR